MTPEQRKIRAADAKALLENTLLKDAFARVGGHLDAQALGCDPDNKDKAQRVVIAMQLLQAVRREIERVIDDGVIAEMEMHELEPRRGLRRFIR